MRSFDLVFYLVNLAVTAVAAAAVLAYWIANRKRISAETVGRAEEHASRVLRDAEREADTKKKEAILEAKEKAHEFRAQSEREAQDRQQKVSALEIALATREARLTDRLRPPPFRRRRRRLASKSSTTGSAPHSRQRPTTNGWCSISSSSSSAWPA